MRFFGYHRASTWRTGTSGANTFIPRTFRVEAEVAQFFETAATLWISLPPPDGSYCWVNDEQHLVRDATPSRPKSSARGATSPRARRPRPPKRRRRPASRRFWRPHPRSSTASRSRKTTERPSSARTSRTCSATARRISDEPDFWRSNVHPEDLAASRPSRNSSSRPAATPRSYRFRKLNGDYIWVTTSNISCAATTASRRDRGLMEQHHCAQGSRAAPRRRARPLRPAAARAPAVIYASRRPATTRRPSSARTSSASGLRARRLSEDARLLAHPRSPGRPSPGRGRVGQTVRGGAARRRIPLPQEDGSIAGSATAASVRDRNGNPLEVIGSWSEITARKPAEQQARERAAPDRRHRDHLGRLLALRQDDRLVLGNATRDAALRSWRDRHRHALRGDHQPRRRDGLIPDARGQPESGSRNRLACIAIQASRCLSIGLTAVGSR